MAGARRIANRLELDALRKSLLTSRSRAKTLITICAGTGCLAWGADSLVRGFQKEVKRRGLGEKVEVKGTGCHGFCERGPLVVIRPEMICYVNVRGKDIPEIISETVLKGNVIERLLYAKDPSGRKKIVREDDIPFYKLQKRIIFGSNGQIDPTSIDDYISIGGYGALSKALFEMTPQEIIEAIKRSGLRGRGGGGFPTGVKWDACRKAPGQEKFVICNADEGDPGAYMDRSLLEGNPHSVIEGITIGSYAIGANQGYVFVRNEYPLAVQNLIIALQQAKEYGLLGEDILDSGFNFDVKPSRGGGAFVCGESSALMASLEGKVGEPRAKYIHTVERGLWDKPSNVNNVETWANIPVILRKGVDWFTGIGTEGSKGTKIFSLVGNIKNTGLVEVPMGTTLRQIVYDIGGGIPNGKVFKAVQTGGPSGGCIPDHLLDSPVDFDRLAEVGSMMGSGGMIVMDEDTCMVDVARYFISFLQEESCGKCTPCREGLLQMGEILTNICEGKGRRGDIELLEELSIVMKDVSLCALGGTAPNPVLSTLRYFRDEYEAHIEDKRCPAGICKALITYSIEATMCNGCHACFSVCPSGAIAGEKKKPHLIDGEKCIKCGACREACNFQAVIVS